MDISAWKRAAIHLEGATDSVEATTIRDQIWHAAQGLEDSAQWREMMARMPARLDVRVRGTAVYVEHEDGSRYLVTARHVLHGPPEIAEATARQMQRPMEGSPDSLRETEHRNARERAESHIHPIVFRVPSLDELLAAASPEDLGWQSFLMSLRAGVPWMTPYTYSAPNLDLAIVSLNQRTTKRFRDSLDAAGHEPVKWTAVGDGPSKEGAAVMAVGYPDGVSVLERIDLPQEFANWSSSLLSLPAVSFGRVAMVHDALPFFWADLSIYPGNSGGAVIENGKLIGIVSSQATTPLEGSVDGRVRIPFARVMRAGQLTELLETQREKDARAES